jgi:hypothetical protein
VNTKIKATSEEHDTRKTSQHYNKEEQLLCFEHLQKKKEWSE